MRSNGPMEMFSNTHISMLVRCWGVGDGTMLNGTSDASMKRAEWGVELGFMEQGKEMT